MIVGFPVPRSLSLPASWSYRRNCLGPSTSLHSLSVAGQSWTQPTLSLQFLTISLYEIYIPQRVGHVHGILPIFQHWCWFFPNFISFGHPIRPRVEGWVFDACTYITLRCRGITQSYIEMLVESIWPVISVSLKHLVNFHFCRTIINLFNSTVYSSIALRSTEFFCLIETALLEVVKNITGCSHISSCLIIKYCENSHVCPLGALRLQLTQKCQLGYKASGRHSVLKLLVVTEEQTVVEWLSVGVWTIMPSLLSLPTCDQFFSGFHTDSGEQHREGQK